MKTKFETLYDSVIIKNTTNIKHEIISSENNNLKCIRCQGIVHQDNGQLKYPVKIDADVCLETNKYKDWYICYLLIYTFNNTNNLKLEFVYTTEHKIQPNNISDFLLSLTDDSRKFLNELEEYIKKQTVEKLKQKDNSWIIYIDII
jgi:hypothetical protein